MLNQHRMLIVLVGLCLVGLVWGLHWGQAQQKGNSDQPPAQTQRATPRNRLPMFYSRVVTAEQREQIYAIQQKFQKQIDELTEQLRAVQAQRDEEIRAVLTPEQQKQIDTWMEELQQKRAAARAKSKSDSSDAQDASDEVDQEPTPPPMPSRSTRNTGRSGKSSANP